MGLYRSPAKLLVSVHKAHFSSVRRNSVFAGSCGLDFALSEDRDAQFCAQAHVEHAVREERGHANVFAPGVEYVEVLCWSELSESGE